MRPPGWSGILARATAPDLRHEARGRFGACHQLAEHRSGFGALPIDAEAAVAKYKPDIVVGCWITQKWHEGDDRGSVHGVEEIRIVRAVDCYVHIGNHRVHSFKRILRLKHKERRAPWIVSRAFEPEENLIWTWGR